MSHPDYKADQSLGHLVRKHIQSLGLETPVTEAVLANEDDKIKSITAIIEWDNDIIDLVHDSRPVSSLIFDAKLLDTYVTDILKGALDGVE